ncbi:penicillin-binding transpeptidase domain-containing protein [Zhihengliuella halotolerans]|uniref:Beta-lactamase n=1 Tax=Zhihengliuella halotolerans TaxID=370736 RepID=A0A4Q8AEM9_9MICC|nr:penicillin-binding transpeptidase domain-containing protein [Zhihengliuella halotolerans]RZU62688.1 cell division protein FtsI/penicillin-binding protein 2 [Zhihengliuella halotolerans]
MRPPLRLLAGLSLAGLVAASLAACGPAIPEPDPAAEALASALEAGDFSAVPLSGTTAEEAADAVELAYAGMGEIPRTHTVTQVAVDDEEQDGVKTASATLQTTWDVDETDNDFTYETQAVWELDAENERWKLRFTPEILAPELGEGESLVAKSTSGERGEILGADGEAIVTDRPVVRVGIDKTRAESSEWEDSARELAELVEIDADSYAARVEAAGEKAWVEAIVLRDDDRDVTDEQIYEIPGAIAQPDDIPLAPTREFARPILGTVGQATAEIIEASEGRIEAGDRVGPSGLQAAYDADLSGTKGVTVTRNSAEDEPVAEIFASEQTDGQDLELTLEEDLQTAAEAVLADVEPASAIVAIRPSDGAVLAAASGPGGEGYNTALLGRYAPGSTFKVVSALAMLRGGATENTTVDCTPTTTVDGKSFKNFDAYPSSALGSIPLSEALAQSCNTVFVNAGDDVGSAPLAEAAAALGLTGEDGTGAGPFLGAVPDDSAGTELAANMIGQGVVQASTLGIATVAASVSAGETVQPRFVLSPEQEAPAEPASKLTTEESEALARMMADVVDHGTLVDLKDLTGGTVIGKSGTAEYDSEQNAHAWAIAAQGDLAVAVFVEEGDGGSRTAGPLVKEFLAAAR